MKPFELLEHTADVKVRVYGATMQELFINALHSLFACMKPVPLYEGGLQENSEPFTPTRHIQIDSPDLQALLVDFLSEALYLSDRYNEAYYTATIEALDDTHIKASLQGIALKRFEGVEVKAITYHDLKIEQKAHGWIAEIVFDI